MRLHVFLDNVNYVLMDHLCEFNRKLNNKEAKNLKVQNVFFSIHQYNSNV